VNSDLAHSVEIEAPSQDGQDDRDLDELLLAASQQFTGKQANQVESESGLAECGRLASISTP